ncbi:MULTISPECIES: cytochrome c biogenesis CcdA family protein [Mycobacteriales]|uniref:Thiol-disulfide oxidoreductase n=1 Tax=Tsukamurella pseudospumae TaxID=239498 RepID=A0A138A0N0_9ACTN|nr:MULTISPECIES: cytochrome c biogenesis CcdA family protein [Mycobacteriales]KXP03982.1 thiol-disulfide oxidoreductase [Tsukamurella pseudospumae]MYV31246.1 cytochrome c biogenesis protein CcdA [Rhodococcus erythropolis]
MSQIGLLGAFLGGLLALLSPCSALLLPSFFAYAFDGAGKLAGRTGIFYLGLAAVLVPLGAGVGAIGSAITRYREVTTMIGGVVIIALGVMIIVGRGFALGSAQRAAARIDVSSTGSVFALGAVYGLAGFCSGPLLGAVLTVAVAGGQAVYGGVLMALYAAGMVIPLFVLALVWDRFSLGSRTWLRGKEISIGPLKTHTTSLISGVLFIGIGVLFLLTEGTANLGGVMGVDSQYSLQVWISDVADAVPNTAVLLIAVLVIIAVLTVRIVRGRDRDTAAESSELGEREDRTL